MLWCSYDFHYQPDYKWQNDDGKFVYKLMNKKIYTYSNDRSSMVEIVIVQLHLFSKWAVIAIV